LDACLAQGIHRLAAVDEVGTSGFHPLCFFNHLVGVDENAVEIEGRSECEHNDEQYFQERHNVFQNPQEHQNEEREAIPGTEEQDQF